jgi:hypothetical protein
MVTYALALILAGTQPTHQSLEDVARRLDLRSFPNSTGPRRTPNAARPADYGFTMLKREGASISLIQSDGSWELGFSPIGREGDTLLLCIRDQALNGGSYDTQEPVAVRKEADGLFHASRTKAHPSSCPPRP